MPIKELDLEAVDIKEDIKKQEFFFYNGTFILCAPEGQKNQVCMFDDIITDEARKYADGRVPPVSYGNDKQRGYISKTRSDYWLVLFNLAVWKYLEKNNVVTYMKHP